MDVRIDKGTTVHLAEALVCAWQDAGLAPLSVQGSVYLYRDGFYKEVENLPGLIMESLEGVQIGDGEKCLGLTFSKCEDVRKAVLHHSAIFDPAAFEDRRVGIGTKDGFYVPYADTYVRVEHSPNNFLRSCVGDSLSFEPPEKLLLFLEQIFGSDDHQEREGKIAVIQEVLGAALSGVPLQRALLLLGSGCNGKSSLMDLLALLVKKVSHVEPRHLNGSTSSYYLAQLADCALNNGGELAADALSKETGCLKALIGRDRFYVRPPFGAPYSIRPSCVNVFSTNHQPIFNDYTSGFSRRFAIMHLTTSFEGRKLDFKSEIWPGIEAERSKILGWALRGASRVVKQRDLTPLKTSQDMLMQIALECPVRDFFESACTPYKPGNTQAASLYDDFTAYVARKKLPEGTSKTKFGRVFTEVLSNYCAANPKMRIGGNVYYKVTVKPQTEWGIESTWN